MSIEVYRAIVFVLILGLFHPKEDKRMPLSCLKGGGVMRGLVVGCPHLTHKVA